MKNTIFLIAWSLLVISYLIYADYAGGKSGASSGIKQCFDREMEGVPNDCRERAAAFLAEYGHPYNE